jgi:predicted nucleic acid-binding protein
MKAEKVLLDLNIVMDLLLARDPYATEAKLLFQKAIKEEFSVYVTSCSISTLIYFMEKTVGYATTRSVINNFLQIAKGINITISDIQKAFINMSITDTEDAIQMQGAIKTGIDIILTRDHDFLKIQGQKIPVMSPTGYLAHKPAIQ